MKDVKSEIEFKGKKYSVVFNLNVMEAIQDEYGTLAEWGKLTSGADCEPNAKAVKFGFTQMLNEGIDIENEENGTENPHLTTNFVGRMLTEMGLQEMTQKLQQTVVESTQSNEKNA